MATIIAVLLTVSALLLFCLALVLTVEIVSGLMAGSSTHRGSELTRASSRLQLAVIVPAHNESVGMLPTLADIRAQLSNRDRLIVVADNCSDDTAAIAASAGAEVVTRDDPSKIGKGHALARGLEHLRSRPPEIVIMVDADCRVADEAIDRLAATCLATGRPTQSLYLMVAPEGSPAGTRVAEFAWRIKNWVRPLGLSALGLPCQLMGSGMAFPWDLIRSVDLASGQIVEDLKLGLDLARAGAAPVFCPSALVTSQFPTSSVGVRTQRQRWEQGHIGMLLTYVPRLLVAAIAEANPRLWFLALDLAIPPLALLAMLLLLVLVLSLIASLLGIVSTPFILTILSVALLIGSLIASWRKRAMDILPASAMPEVITYFFQKLPLYLNILLYRSRLHWIKTDRGKPLS